MIIVRYNKAINHTFITYSIKEKLFKKLDYVEQLLKQLNCSKISKLFINKVAIHLILNLN